MNDDRVLRDLEERCARTLHAAAPVPPAGFAERCLARTAVEPQRRGLGIGLLRFGPPLAAVAAVVVLAAVVGLQVGNLIPDRGPGSVPTVAPTVAPSVAPSSPPSSPSASPTVAPTPDVTPSPQPSPTEPAAFPGGSATCTNDRLGYTVSYPADWVTNEEMDLDEFEPGPDTSACTYFGEGPMDLRPNAALPASVAISFARESEAPPAAGEVVSERDLVVDGRPATVREYAVPDGDLFLGDGARVYQAVVELEGGEVLILGTDSTRDGDYAQHRDVLDAMLSTLELD